MDRDETVALFLQGREAWNAWAEKMLAEREALKEASRWAAERTRWEKKAWADFSRCFFLVAGGDEAKKTLATVKTIQLDSGAIEFERFLFPDDVSFDKATFSGDADFKAASFSGDANFGNAAFWGTATFSITTFSRHAYFANAEFWQGAHFVGATCQNLLLFNDAKSLVSQR